MKKFGIFFLIFSLFIVNVSAASKEDLERALAKAKPIFHEYIVPAKFRNVIISLFGTGGYDKINTETMTDYSVMNTQRLGMYFTKNHFIHFPKNCEATQVAKGVNKMGEIICGAKISSILVDVRVTDGTGVLYNPQTKETRQLAKNDTFSVNGKVALTTSDQSLEIAFADNSIIRLETDTKITLSDIKNYDGIRTLAEVSYDKGLLWGRVMSPDGPSFRHGEIIAGVRGTSIALTNDSIYALQSQNEKNAVNITQSGTTFKADIPKCSKISIKNLQSNDKIASDKHCIEANISYKGNRDIVRENTKKDIAYINTLVAENKGNDFIQAERTIAGPTQIELQSNFCTDNTKKVFWPNVLDASQMCQEEKVFAVATITREKAEIIYKDGNEFKIVTGEIFPKDASKNPDIAYKAIFKQKDVEKFLQKDTYEAKFVANQGQRIQTIVDYTNEVLYLGGNERSNLIRDNYNNFIFKQK